MRPGRFLVAFALTAALTVPLATMHPLSAHFGDSGHAAVRAPLSWAALLVLFALVALSLAPLWRVAAFAARSWRSARGLGALRLAAVGTHAEGGIPYTLLAVPGVHFFTAGLVRPRIYASADARANLSPPVFRAALLHEQAHQRRHDVAWRLLLAALEAAFRPFPGVERTAAAIALDWELAADRAALAAGASREHLFEAIAASVSNSSRPVAALAGVGLQTRLERLAKPEAINAHRTPALPFAPAAALALVPLAVHGLFWVEAVCL